MANSSKDENEIEGEVSRALMDHRGRDENLLRTAIVVSDFAATMTYRREIWKVGL